MKFSKDYVMFCHITTMIQDDKYPELLLEKGGLGWPHFVFMDAEGNVIARHDDEPSAPAFAKTGENAKAFLALKAKADKGDPAAQVELLLTQLEMGQLKPADAEKKFKEAKPTREQEAKFAALLVNLRVTAEVDALESKAQEKALGKKYFEAFKSGSPGPTARLPMQSYYVMVLEHAEEVKDAKTFEAALAVLKEKFGKTDAAKDYLEEQEKKLAELKGEKK